MVTAESCPYLGTEDSQKGPVLAPSPHHRCNALRSPERVGLSHQADICLTSDYRGCSRLAAQGAGHEKKDERASWLRPVVRRPELQRSAATKKVSPRRPWTFAEIMVMGLGISILLAVLFVVFVFVYRVGVGPGMRVAPTVAGGSGQTAIETLPTLVPTFTPTLSSDQAPLTATTPTPSSPTPVAEPVLPVPTVAVRLPASSPPTRLVIPKIGLDVPVLTVGAIKVKRGGKTQLVWADVPNAGAFHETSAYPGNPGNTVINGHRDISGSIFRNLDDLEPGDEIMLYVGDVVYLYYVAETVILPETFASAEQRADNLKYIGFMPEERLTLVTCTPPGLATHRLLVIARPPDQVAPQMPEAGVGTEP